MKDSEIAPKEDDVEISYGDKSVKGGKTWMRNNMLKCFHFTAT